ncbi:MAG: hypothetical protein JRD03_11750 [Deltaproteobacteria bacterium]|nr:hypothetical protein [Deltaproteobacteria bacterium]
MSIQTIMKAFIVTSLLSLGLAGVSWSGDAEQKDTGETASVDAAPPANAADEDANAEKAEAADAEKEEAAKD